MISKRMFKMANGSSAIRQMFEEGNRMAAVYGRENVYDFSLGNPNVPAPEAVGDAIKAVVENEKSTFVHGYMPNAGYPDVRRAVADNLNRRFGTEFTEGNIIMTVGAAGAINCVLQTLLDKDDEVIVFAPYFLEYGNYVSNWGGVLKCIPAKAPEFMPDPEALRAALTERTKALILNNPNNPTGVVYSREVLTAVADVLREKEREYGHPIYVLSDEPYRELAYDGVEVPFLPTVYDDTVVVYSWSKSLSLPGERIGYIAISPKAADADLFFTAAVTSNRILGFVNAPSLMQRALLGCIDCSTDISAYDKNRKLLLETLTRLGFECTHPAGAFYLWVKTPIPDPEFVAKAKEHRIFLVAGSSFACPGYVRIAYCVSYEQIERSISSFEALAAETVKK